MEADDWTIRRAAAPDQPSLADLWQAFMEEQAAHDDRLRIADDARERWMHDVPLWLDDTTIRLWVAVAEGRIVGFARAHRTGPPPVYEDCAEVYIDEVYVDTSHRRKGIATALVDTVSNWASSVGADRLRLSTVTANAGADAFWNAWGAAPLATIWTAPVPANGGSAEGGADLNEGSAKIGFDWN